MQIKINVNLTGQSGEYRWHATFDSYDGAEDSGNRAWIGYGSDAADAVHDLVMNHIEDELKAQGCGLPSPTEAPPALQT